MAPRSSPAPATAIRQAFEAWLSPGNFDTEGRRKTPLATPR